MPRRERDDASSSAPSLAGGSLRREREVGVDADDCSFAQAAANRHIPAEEAGEAPGDRQTEAGAFVGAAPCICLREGLEDVRELVRRDAGAGVLDFDDAAIVRPGGAEHDATAIGELDGVRDQVDQHLLELRRVGDETGRSGETSVSISIPFFSATPRISSRTPETSAAASTGAGKSSSARPRSSTGRAGR